MIIIRNYFRLENLNFPDERWVLILRVELGEWASIRNFFFFILRLFLENLLGRLNQQSFHVMTNFFILRLISSHPRVWKSFLLYAWLAFIPKYKKNCFWKNIRNFFRCFSFVFWARGLKVCQVALVSATFQILFVFPMHTSL